ncbi:MAG: hypothetical protein NTY77_01635 [Elusimicrobia bacterium]|nr:hypothetical protein [Elusimicrobiota bacterium]
MADLWGDVWFYISTLGFLGSGALFLYLLGQYRSAVEETDESDTASPSQEAASVEPPPAQPAVLELTPVPVATPIVSWPKTKTKTAPAVALPVAAAPSAKVEPQPSPTTAKASPVSARGVGAPAPAKGAAPERRAGDGVNPTVAYLQNIRSQMERFDKNIAALKALSAQQAAQGQLVLKKLSELAEGFKTGAGREEIRPAGTGGTSDTVGGASDTAGVSPSSAFPAATRSADLALETVPQAAPASQSGALQPAQAAEPEPASAAPESVLPIPAQEPEAEAEPPAAAVVEAPPQEPATPEPASPAPEPELEPAVRPFQPRKGPVWPV